MDSDVHPTAPPIHSQTWINSRTESALSEERLCSLERRPYDPPYVFMASVHCNLPNKTFGFLTYRLCTGEMELPGCLEIYCTVALRWNGKLKFKSVPPVREEAYGGEWGFWPNSVSQLSQWNCKATVVIFIAPECLLDLDIVTARIPSCRQDYYGRKWQVEVLQPLPKSKQRWTRHPYGYCRDECHLQNFERSQGAESYYHSFNSPNWPMERQMVLGKWVDYCKLKQIVTITVATSDTWKSAIDLEKVFLFLLINKENYRQFAFNL